MNFTKLLIQGNHTEPSLSDVALLPTALQAFKPYLHWPSFSGENEQGTFFFFLLWTTTVITCFRHQTSPMYMSLHRKRVKN
jgi:hypothetical protein